MSDEAREAVARALRNSVYGVERDHEWPTLNGRLKIQYFEEAETILAALKPIIAAEIRTHREELNEENVCICGHHGSYPNHVADRITTGGEQ